MTKIPMYFDDFDPDDPDINFRAKRWDYWSILKKIREEFMETHAVFNVFTFNDYIVETYGINMVIIEGKITDKFEILDEQKHLLFLLKWK
jgi:hypothetical protein